MIYIIPLVTHGGCGLGNILDIVAGHARRAIFVNGFSLQTPQERQTIEQVTE